MSDTWERVNGLWVGRRELVSDDFFAAARSEVETLPPHVTAALSGGRVCIYVVRRLTDAHHSFDDDGRGCMKDSPHWRGKPLNAADGVYWDGCWKEGRRWRPAAAVAQEYVGDDGVYRPWYRLHYVLRHELGHGYAQRACGQRYGHSDPAFRAAYLDERRAALADPIAATDLDYFLGHWANGVAETFAECFAAVVGTLDWGDDLFRRTFPRCIDLVRQNLDALIDGAAIAT